MKVIAVASILSKEGLSQADIVVQKLAEIKLSVKSREVQIQLKQEYQTSH